MRVAPSRYVAVIFALLRHLVERARGLQSWPIKFPELLPPESRAHLLRSAVVSCSKSETCDVVLVHRFPYITAS